MRIPFIKKSKKNKVPYPKSFGKRITRRIMLRMLIIMGIPSFLLFWTGYLVVYGSVDVIFQKVFKGEYEEVRRITSDVYVASINTAPFIEENLNNPDKLYSILEQMVSKNIRIRSCGISFKENYYPQKGRWFCPYAVRKDSVTIDVKTIGDKDYDYLNSEWFREAMAAEGGYWSKGFVDETDGQTPLVSYLLPIRDRQNRTVAVLGVDMSLDWLTERVSLKPNSKNRGNDSVRWSAKRELYYFMTDTTGMLLVHPDRGRILKENVKDFIHADPDSVSQEMFTNESGDDDELVLDGEKVKIFFARVKYTDWILAFVMPMIYIDIFGYILGGVFILFIAIGLLVVFFSGRLYIKRAVKPINQLAASANEVAKGNFKAQLPEVKTHDEIHQLRDSFEMMQVFLGRYIEELKTTTAQKASIESELKIAHDIQVSMLPKIFPPYPERNDIDIYGMQTPAKAVGGDLFDFFIRDNRLFFCIGDVSGKGVPASMFMAVTRSLFRNVSHQADEPQRIVKALNDSICDGNEMNMFVTLFVGVLNLDTGCLLYCNAGHNAPLLLGDGVKVLPCDANLPIGVMADWAFSQQEMTITPMTTVFLFTDGLSEAENEGHVLFGDDGVTDVAKRLLCHDGHEPMPLINGMTEAVRRFVGDAEQSDDMTMLAIQYKKTS